MELSDNQQVQPSTILSKECRFASSLSGKQTIKTISISEWEVEKAAIIPVTQTEHPLP